MNNLVKRSLSGLVFLAIMIFCIWHGGMAFLLLSCFVVAVGMWEFFNMLLPKGNVLQKCLSIFVGIAIIMILPAKSIYSNHYSEYPDIFFIIPLTFPLAVLAIFIAELYTKAEKPFVNIAIYILAIIYIAIPFALMQFIVDRDPDPSTNSMLLAFFIIIWANDVGAYCVGCTLGKKIKAKLFPRISPNKSWAGFFGGFVFAMLAGALCAKFMLDQPIIHWIKIGAIASIFGTFGDLIESMLKRSVGVKDSGKIMPGHGGILDRFDAVLLAYPPVYYYMVCFLI